MKVPKNLTRAEQETLIRTSAAYREWDFYTRDPKFRRRLEKRGYHIQEDHQGLWSCKIPLGRVSILRQKSAAPRKTAFPAKRTAQEAISGKTEGGNE